MAAAAAAAGAAGAGAGASAASAGGVGLARLRADSLLSLCAGLRFASSPLQANMTLSA